MEDFIILLDSMEIKELLNKFNIMMIKIMKYIFVLIFDCIFCMYVFKIKFGNLFLFYFCEK